MLFKVRSEVRRRLGAKSMGEQLRNAFPRSKFVLAEVKAELAKIANTPFRVWRMLIPTAEHTTGHFGRQSYIKHLAESIGRSLQQQSIFKEGVPDADSD